MTPPPHVEFVNSPCNVYLLSIAVQASEIFDIDPKNFKL